ncbi:iron dicitrate transport regulator FecR [Siphonobacter sp. BAB-5385]|uniref:FecR family protein n=1 Tax=Siphonobacter sp. BAB-5385 TaxID=1864822 RepID=UPI000B9EC5BB|nr:FecR domain-containing protein [Siphonobacter sp. BAB-5385]OZI05977.1 iron dicitrate transport regulator FecR [Siphonobacter sp. BAB-5385]
MNPLINKQLIFDFFSGKATVLQRKQIEAWSQDPQNEELFYEWLQEWERSHLQYHPDQEKAYSQFKDFLYNDQRPTFSNVEPESTDRWRNYRKWLLPSIAASLLVLLGYFYQDRLLNQRYATGYGQVKVVQLTDGSRVTLNANSTLQVPRFGFLGKRRQVKLEGEALFSITHTPDDQPFVVKTDHGSEVVVLGTEFNLFTRSRATEVALLQGSVEFHYQKQGNKGDAVRLKPGDLVKLPSKGNVQLKKWDRSHHFSSWREHRYVFKETSLQELTYLFEENFGIVLRIPESRTAALTLSGAYPAESAEELLSIIAEVLNLRIIHQDKEIILQSTSLT